MDTDTTSATPEALRVSMVEKVKKSGPAQRPEVERVLHATRRHGFVPNADLATTYSPWQAVVTHRFDHGRALSCASAPWLVAARHRAGSAVAQDTTCGVQVQ